ncbi:transcriptional regulator [Candidatus Marinamargulisbacteria bacterium SCGC AG-333-B06]|nr:transcriptional regulator [Candidatus Marinamargulisbacteria bacterium SCGC AG-333-B06]
MKVKLLDLDRQYAGKEELIMAAVKDVFDSKQFIMGPKVKELESVMADYTQSKFAIGVSSGTDALLVSLMALGIQPGDEVITTPFSFFATAGCIARLGATPVFVDIDPHTYNINPDLIEAKITAKTKVIIPVHLFGQLADMNRIMNLANKHGLHVIEDAAQSIGSKCLYKGSLKDAGSIGDLGCFSFFPSKNLGCCGDGGMITTNDADLAEKCRVLRVHGSKPKYYHHVVGGNFRLDPIQAAILLVKLPYLNDQHEKRRANALYYNENLSDNYVKPFVTDGYYMIYNQYTLRSDKRDDVLAKLESADIGSVIYYPVPLHLQVCFSNLGYSEGDFPEAEKASCSVFSIPIYSELTVQEQRYVVEVLNSIF